MYTKRIQALIAALVASTTLLFCGSALADKASLKANLAAARERVVTLVGGKGDVPALKGEIAALSAKIDAEAGTVPEFKPLWDQFRSNRDTKIIPAYDGSKPQDQEAAKALALGEQKQLYEKMMALLN